MKFPKRDNAEVSSPEEILRCVIKKHLLSTPVCHQRGVWGLQKRVQVNKPGVTINVGE